MLEHFLNNPATGVISPQITTASRKTAHHYQVQVDAKNFSPKTLLQIANLPSVQRLVVRYGTADDLAELLMVQLVHRNFLLIDGKIYTSIY